MTKKGIMGSLGVWAFVVGLVLSAVIALVSGTNVSSWVVILIAVLGLIVGLMNVSDKEVQLFLVAAVAFMLSFQSLATVTQTVVLGWSAVGTFFNLMGVFIAPAAAVVAIKALFNLAKN